jgi:hypothetical protein
VWAEEWRGAVVLLAALADHDRARLRLAAATDWVEPVVQHLLRDAAPRNVELGSAVGTAITLAR